MRDINFFSQSINAVSSAKRKTTVLMAVIAGLLVIVGGVYGMTALTVMSLPIDIKQSRNYLESSEVINGKKVLQEKRTQLELLKQYDAAVTGIQANIDNSDKVRSELIEKINGTLPGGVEVLNINLTQQTVVISAEAGSRTQIAELEHNLLETQLFTKVHIGSIGGEDGSGKFTFSANCQLKEVIEK